MTSNRYATVTLALVVVAAAATLTAGLPWEAAAFESRTDRQNSIRVDVTPLQLEPGRPARFEVRMNTHSVTLSHDMQAVSTLRDNDGNTYTPTAWSGSPPGGHHRRGTLEFPQIQGDPASIELVIRDPADGATRMFEWSLPR